MFATSSWSSRLVLAVLALQLASACKPDPTPPPPPSGNSDTTPPSTRANPQGGNFTASLTVTLTCEDGTGSGCAATYFTTDGSTPSASSQRYTSPVAVSKSTTLKFFSVDAAGNAEAPQTQGYVVDTVPPLTVATPAGGIINSARTVALQCTDGDGTGSGCAATYYTTDGSAPTTGSPRYSAPLLVSASTTLRFFSVDVVGNTEAAKTEQYTLDATAPTVAASPAAGNYNAPQTVTLSCEDGLGTGCGPIHYTTDGSLPSASAPAYTAPLRVSANTTLRFFATDGAGNSSPVVSAVYVIDETGPATTATPPGGISNAPVSVTLTCDDGAGLGCAGTYYTTDGSPPTTGSARYTTALSITSSTTLKFFSVDKLGNPGPTGSAQYTLDFTAPITTANPPGGIYSSEQTVVLDCKDGTGTGCAATYYTLDGTLPTRSSPRYTAPLRITGNTPLRFFSVDKANNTESVRTEEYDLDSVAPVTRATPAGGLYKSNQSVVLSCDDGVGSGCSETHYTVDGSTPTLASPMYTSALLLTGNTTLRFFSVDLAGNHEATQTETYTIDTVAPSTTATPAAGTYGSAVSVTLACDDGASGSGCAETHYTVDGTAPTTSSPLYTSALSLSATTTLRYFSTDKAGNKEPTRVALYTLDQVAPTVSASPKGGLFNKAQSITLTCSDTGGSSCDAIHYTLDGSTPSLASATYSAPLIVSTTTTLKFLAVDKVGNASAVSTELYRIDDVAPSTTAIRAGGAYASAQSVTLLCADGSGTGCAATYYTLDGSTPTTGSSRYASPISITANATLRFFSVDVAGNAEPPRTETYIIDAVSPTVSADPASGAYNSAQSVTLSCTDNSGGSGCAAIHYTTDGSTPTMASPLYTAPLSVSTNTSLAFFAVDTVGNVSATQYAWYVIDTVAPTTGVYPSGGSYTGTVYAYLYCSDDSSGCAAIHYTTDGSTPTTSSPVVTTGYVSLNATTTLKFFGVDAAGNAETVHTETYVITPDTAPPTTYASPAGGNYTSAQYVYLNCSDNTWCANTYYTLDGSEPTTASTPYSGYLYIASATTLKFFSVDGSGNAEPVHTETYVFGPDTQPPTTYASPAGGTYSTAQYVYLNCSDNSWCANTYYTLDGSEPTTASTPYYGYAFYISSSTTLKFFSVDGYGNAEPVRTETYVFGPDTQAPSTYASPPGGTYTSTQYVYLYCYDNTSCANTYYTLDGSEPTTASTRFTGYIPISSDTTLKFFSVDGAGNAEPVRTETYVFGPDTTPPTTYATPPGGTYTSVQYVYLSCYDETSCANTYYTLDGSEPTTASPRYTGPLYLSSNTTLKFFSVDGAGNTEPVRTETYVIETPPADPSAQIARIRSLSDGSMYEPISGALVTYTKATTGPSDPAGFFLQASAEGPAVFVAVDPLTLSPTPQPGDRVSLYATQKLTVNGTVEVTQLDTGFFSIYSRGESVEPLRNYVSSSDLVFYLGNYESELISFNGTVVSDFASAGTGHVSANVVSLGNSTVNPNLKLRLTTSLQSTLDVTQGCSINTSAPLWRFNTQAQPSAWASGDLTILACPAPKVTGAASTSGTTVVVAFDRRIDPVSVNANGSQFTFDNGLVATSATVSDRQVQLTTSSQVGGTSYRVTVASSILDTRGTALDGSANSATFTGYGSTPTPGTAQLRISEVSPGIANGRDLVELVAIKGGSVDGFTLTMGATVMATFPNVQVAAGDVIVVHIKPDSATNGDATESETSSKTQLPAAMNPANYDTAWDFLGSTTTEIGYSRRVLRMRDATGAVQDGAAFGRTGGTPPSDFLTQLQALQSEGQWLPADCGGVSCSDTTTPTALGVSVDWAGCGTTRGGNSVRRVSATDTNMLGDWAVGTSSFGLANP